MNDAIAGLYGKSFLTTRDASDTELGAILDLARAFERLDREGIGVPFLRDQLAYAMFFDQSTRTKSAWAGAASRLGMQPVIVDGSSTQVSHGETAAETGAMLGMNSHAMGVRHDLILGEGNRFMREVLRGIDEYHGAIGEERVVPVINLQCDIDHPTQTLADLLWLQRTFPRAPSAGKKHRGELGLLAELCQAAESVPQGLADAAASFWRACAPWRTHEGYRLMDQCLDYGREQAADRKWWVSLTVCHDMDASVCRRARWSIPRAGGPTT